MRLQGAVHTPCSSDGDSTCCNLKSQLAMNDDSNAGRRLYRTSHRFQLSWTLRLQHRHEQVYWVEVGNHNHLRSDFAYNSVMVLLHALLLTRPIHAIFFISRLCRLSSSVFQLFAQVCGRSAPRLHAALRPDVT